MKKYLVLAIFLILVNFSYCQDTSWVWDDSIDWSDPDTLMDIYKAGGYNNYVNGVGPSDDKYHEIDMCISDNDLCFVVEVPANWDNGGCKQEFNPEFSKLADKSNPPDNMTLYTITCSDVSRNFFGSFTIVRDSQNIEQETDWVNPMPTSDLMKVYNGVVPSGYGYYASYSLYNAELNDKSIDEDIEYILSSVYWDFIKE